MTFDFDAVKLPKTSISRGEKNVSFECEADGSLVIEDATNRYSCAKLPQWIVKDLGRFIREVYGE